MSNHSFLTISDIFFTFSRHVVGDSILDNLFKFCLILWFVSLFVHFIVFLSSKFSKHITLQVFLFEGFPSISVHFDASQSEESLLFSILSVFTHSIQANDILHLLSLKFFWLDLLPFFLFRDPIFTSLFFCQLLFMLLLFPFLLFDLLLLLSN